MAEKWQTIGHIILIPDSSRITNEDWARCQISFRNSVCNCVGLCSSFIILTLLSFVFCVGRAEIPEIVRYAKDHEGEARYEN